MLLYREQRQDLLSSTLVSRLQITLRTANRGLSNDDSDGKKRREKKGIFPVSNLIVLVPSRSICQMLGNVSGVEGTVQTDSEKEKENRCRGIGRILNRLKIIAFWCSVQTEPP